MLEKQIKNYLCSGFEQQLFDAAILNLDDNTNALSLNNFTYAIRELIRHFLFRLAPDNEIQKACWYNEQKNANGIVVITRYQRIKFAIQRWFSDDFLENGLQLNINETITNLKNDIDALSKYTHIEPTTFGVSPQIKVMESLQVLGDVLRFFMDINECVGKVRESIITNVTNELDTLFSIETFDDIDILSTHSSIEASVIEQYNLTEHEDHIDIFVSGHVKTRLQIGSNSDLRNDDGYETYELFPFSATCSALIKNANGVIEYTKPDINFDTDSWFN